MNITERCSSALEREASEIGARVRAQEPELLACAKNVAPDLVQGGPPTMEIADTFRSLTDAQLPTAISTLRQFFREHHDAPAFDSAVGCMVRAIKGAGVAR